jgi:PKD repeat protein
MMKNIVLTLFIALLAGSSYSQNQIGIFRAIDDDQIKLRSVEVIENAVYAELDLREFNDRSNELKDGLILSLPLGHLRNGVDLTMKQFDFLRYDFRVTGSQSGAFDYRPGKHYIAETLSGDGSGAFSFFDNSMMGILALKNGDHINIGEIRNSDGVYIIYSDKDLGWDPVFYCDTEDQDDDFDHFSAFSEPTSFRNTKCVDFYIEADYEVFKQNNFSIQQSVDFLLGLFAETVILFRNEGIDIKVSAIKVWETKDDYDQDRSHTALNQFADRYAGNEFDLNLLVAAGPSGLGGVAFINALCRPNRNFAYANIDMNYNNIPAYSWSVMVVTHELGHNFGSNHTHACRWNGNFTQIDDCGNIYAYNRGNTPEGNNCFNPDAPVIPSDGGTIMSYCHLNSTGINLSKGFHKQVSVVMRNALMSADCVDDCNAFGTDKPVADFAAGNNLTCMNGEVQFTDLSLNHPVDWTWIFQSEGISDTFYHKNPSYVFRHEGLFDVTLIVSNGKGADTLFLENHISVIPGPVANFSYEMIDNQTVQFINNSTNADSYFWKLGNTLVSFKKDPVQKYNNGGFYTVELRATKDTCNTHDYFVDTIEIRIPLRAIISFNKNRICERESIFYKAGRTDYDSVKWIFQGGHIGESTDMEVELNYNNSGTFGLQFIAFSKYGADTITRNNIITVTGAPEVYFKHAIDADTVFFTNSSLGATSFEWDFGDGNQSKLREPSHVFESSGKYTVTLKGLNQCDSSEYSTDVIFTKVSVSDIEEEKILIYPNPGSDNFYILNTSGHNSINRIRILDINGKMIFNSIYLGGERSIEIDMKSNPSGIYNIELMVNDKIINKKFVRVK